MPYEDNLAKVASKKFIHLTTRGRKTGHAHMVELWFAVGDGKVHLSHEGKETDRMKNMKKNDQVFLTSVGRGSLGKHDT